MKHSQFKQSLRFHITLFLTLLTIILLKPVLAGTLLVASTTCSKVDLIDEKKLTHIKQVHVGYMPHEVNVSPNGKIALVSNWGDLLNIIAGHSLSVIDIAKGEVIRTIELPKRSRPHGLTFLSDSEALVTAEGIQSLLHVNVETGQVIKTLPLPGKGVHMVIVDNNQHFAYLSNTESGTMTKVNLQTWQVISETKVGKQSEGITFTPDQNYILNTNSKDHFVAVIRAKDGVVIKTIPTNKGPVRVVVANHGNSAVISNSISGTVQILDLATLSMVQQFQSTKSHALLFAPSNIVVRDNQTTAYVTNFLASNVSLIDLHDSKVLKTIKTDLQPNGIAFSPVEVTTSH